MYVVIALFAIGIVAKLLHVQLVHGSELKQEAKTWSYEYRTIEAPRGNIYAGGREKLALAITVPRYNVFMDVFTVREQLFQEQVDSLSWHLAKLFPEKNQLQWKTALREKRADSARYYSIQKRMRYDELQQLKRFPIFREGQFKGGLIVLPENERVNPYGQLARRTIGRYRNKPTQVGLEGAYAKELKGRNGYQLMKQISGDAWKPVDDEEAVEPISGNDLYATIDVNIQDVAHAALKKQLEEQKAERGCAVLMEVETGHIKAIANLSRAEDGNYYEMENMAVGMAGEPGSTFKLATLMVLLDQGKVRLSDTVDAVGKYNFYDAALHDSRSWGYGRISLQQAFEKSSNVIARVADDNFKNNPMEFINGLRKIGLHQKNGVDIIGEGKPYIKDVKDKSFSGISVPWMSIGYEVKITPLQTLTFYNAVANNGKMVKPQFVKEVRNGNEVLRTIETEVLNEQICKPTTLKDVKAMLEGVVESGTAKNIRARGFKIAGKTGTARLHQGGGYSDKHQASFCGYFPAENPKYSCIVVVQGPTKDIYGSIVSGTVFKEIADKVYASSVDINQSKTQEELLVKVQPKSKYGNKSDLMAVLQKMGVGVQNKAAGSDWVITRSADRFVEVDVRKVEVDKIPNVKGMGLVDALYLLESAGLFVEVRGSGVVKRQSLQPGQQVIKGGRITIELS